MKSNFLRFLLVISLIFNISIISAAGYVFLRHRHRAKMFGDMPMREQVIFEKLGLRPDQIKALTDKSAAFRTEVDKKREDVIRERRALLALLKSGASKESIDGEISKISGVQEDIQRMAAAHILEEKAVLDKDQQDKFFDLLDRSMERRRHGTPWR